MDESAATPFGRYTGRLILELLPDGRLMRVVEPFGFVDPKDKRWPVPVGTKVDGASIPKGLWSMIGGPFEGKYRNASVVHDYYCDVRVEPWKAVHRVFYYAMRASGVAKPRAKVMFAAVYYAGPRWGDTTVDNARLPVPGRATTLLDVNQSPLGMGFLDAVSVDGESAHDIVSERRTIRPQNDELMLRLSEIEKLIESDDPDLESIENAIDMIDSATVVLESPADAEEFVHVVDAEGLSAG